MLDRAPMTPRLRPIDWTVRHHPGQGCAGLDWSARCAVEPGAIAGRGTEAQAPSDEATGLVETPEPELADHHRFLEQLPLRVTAANPVDLPVDRFHEGHRPREVAGHVGGDAANER